MRDLSISSLLLGFFVILVGAPAVGFALGATLNVWNVGFSLVPTFVVVVAVVLWAINFYIAFHLLESNSYLKVRRLLYLSIFLSVAIFAYPGMFGLFEHGNAESSDTEQNLMNIYIVALKLSPVIFAIGGMCQVLDAWVKQRKWNMTNQG